MKHIKSCTLALAILSASWAHAQQTVSLVWPFSMGDTQAQFSRSLVEELNRNQKKYTFILENRPGAGSAIAAKYVTATPNTVMAASTAFFVRPNFYPAESHRTSDFRPLMTQCALPMVMISKKYRAWSDIDRNQKISIGVSGLGTTSHLVAMEIARRYPNAIVVPYKGGIEASLDVMSGNTDMAVGFLGEISGFLDKGDLFALGTTGRNPVRGIATLESQGFAGMNQVVNMHSLQVPVTMPEEQYTELRAMVVQVARADSVQRAYGVDHCEPSNLDAAATQRWFDSQIVLWKRLAQNVQLNK